MLKIPALGAVISRTLLNVLKDLTISEASRTIELSSMYSLMDGVAIADKSQSPSMISDPWYRAFRSITEVWSNIFTIGITQIHGTLENLLPSKSTDIPSKNT